MFDHDEEDKDLDSQVSKGQTKQSDDSRGEREETPGPEPHEPNSKQHPTNHGEPATVEEPSSTISENPQSTTNSLHSIKAIPESAIPEKLVNPPVSGDKK